MTVAKIHTIRPGWDIAPLAKGGWGIFYNDQRCKDPMGQTGLAKRFKTPGDAVIALRDCTFEPLDN